MPEHGSQQLRGGRVPQADAAILATGGDEGTVGRPGDGQDVAAVRPAVAILAGRGVEQANRVPGSPEERLAILTETVDPADAGRRDQDARLGVGIGEVPKLDLLLRAFLPRAGCQRQGCAVGRKSERPSGLLAAGWIGGQGDLALEFARGHVQDTDAGSRAAGGQLGAIVAEGSAVGQGLLAQILENLAGRYVPDARLPAK